MKTMAQEVNDSRECLRLYIGKLKQCSPPKRRGDLALYRRGYLDAIRVLEANLEILDTASKLAAELTGDSERPKPNASELDVIFRIRRRIEDILTAPAFSGRKSERRITVNAKEAEVIRKHIGDTIHPDALKVSRPGFVCSLAGVWILEELG